VIAVPPALFYVLGLVALWVQLSSEYSFPGYDSAWFAASLVTRATAASLGAEIVFRGLFVASAAAAVLLLGAYIVLKLLRRGQSYSGVPRIPPLIIPLSVGSLSLLLFIAISADGRAPLVPTFRILGGLALLYFFLFFFYWILGGESRAFLKRGLNFYPGWLYSTIAMLSVLCMGASALFPEEPRLLCLYRETVEGDVVAGEVVSVQRAEELTDYRTLEGGFLGHSAGYWYVIGANNLDLQAIPDDGATRILKGEFYVAHTKIGPDGKPTGQPVTEEMTRSGETYTLSGGCNP
jgi:hypothetical protein